jgi:hypothetical protein
MKVANDDDDTGPIVVEEVEHRELHHHRRSARRFGRRDWIREGLPEIFKVNHAAHCRFSASIARVAGQRMEQYAGSSVTCRGLCAR